MIFYTQKISGNIGNTPYSIREFGCLGCSFGMILEVDPREIFKHAEYFNSDGLLTNPQKLCDDFGGEWNSNRGDLGIRPVIVETRFDGKLHFVVWTGDRFYDPLSVNGNPLRDYKIISFRNVKKGGDMSWYSIGDKVFNNNVYIGDPNQVPWGEVNKLNPQGYELTPQGKVSELETAKANLIQGSIEKEAMIKAITEKNTELEEANETCHELVDEAYNERDKALNKLDKCTDDLVKCKNACQGIVEPKRNIWQRLIDFINKIWKERE